jgi:two-component system OmpR family response regulator
MESSIPFTLRTMKRHEFNNLCRILVVDDEESIRNLLCETLRLGGFTPTAAKSGADAISLIRREAFDLVLLDINMPIVDGFKVLEKIKALKKELPIIMLSARSDKSDVIAGLKDGADDYISKPFSIEELITRIETVLRRANPVSQNSVLKVGPISLNSDTYEVHFYDEPVELSKTEFRLLQYLMEHPGIVLEKDSILNAIWGYDFDAITTVVDTYISYLRKKLHRDGYEGIRTVRGVGFQIKAE